MESSPLVSIVVPTLNQGQFIEKCLVSVVRQTKAQYELIVIDGGSSDQTLHIIERYRSKISYFISEPDNGQANAIAKGFDVAKGEILCWLNSDDFFEDDAISYVQEQFAADNDLLMLIGKSIMVNYLGKDYTTELPSSDLESNLLCGQACPQSSTFIRKDAYVAAGKINQILHFTMDWDLFARISLLGRYKFVNVVLSRQSLHVEGKMVKDSSKFVPEGTFVFLQLLSIIRGGDFYIDKMYWNLKLKESSIAPLATVPKFSLAKRKLRVAVSMFLSKRAHYLYSVMKLDELRSTLALIATLDSYYYLRKKLFILHLKSYLTPPLVSNSRRIKQAFAIYPKCKRP